ncbi:hypothetical protein EVAR_89354_1 [Eumeta japonica]|uniref:Uncharacterized protein n=1 Tax=Eumeta variegata TaxID=151549 RepID=A0A4C1Y2V1_EUMVA|nr:hypothetical protein EVAR_89354_1 [Eumeta japonica]
MGGGYVGATIVISLTGTSKNSLILAFREFRAEWLISRGLIQRSERVVHGKVQDREGAKCPGVSKGGIKIGAGAKKQPQKAEITSPPPKTPFHDHGRGAGGPAETTKIGGGSRTGGCGCDGRQGVFTALEAVGGFAGQASLKAEIGRPSLSASGKSARGDLSGETPWTGTHYLSSVPEDAHPIGKLAKIGELALRLEESRSRYIFERERKKARRARDYEATEKRIAKFAKRTWTGYSKWRINLKKWLPRSPRRDLCWDTSTSRRN